MDFKQAWRSVGNPSPGNTTWSADVQGRPVFTAWASRDLRFDRATRKTEYFSPAGDWVLRGEGQSYLQRAQHALESKWVCRLILLEGKEPWDKVVSAYVDERFYAVEFVKVECTGELQGDLLTRGEFITRGQSSDA